MSDLIVRKDLPKVSEPLTRDLIKEIAMGIGKDTIAYIEVMYPEAIKSTSSSFKLSVRNHIYNGIMEAVRFTNEGTVEWNLAQREQFRRQWLKRWRNMRRTKTGVRMTRKPPKGRA